MDKHTVNLLVAVPAEMRKRLRIRAAETGRTLTALVREAIDNLLREGPTYVP